MTSAVFSRQIKTLMEILENINSQNIYLVPKVLEVLAEYILGSPHPQTELKWMEEVGYLDTIEQLQQSHPELLPLIMSFFENFQQFQSRPSSWGSCLILPSGEQFLLH